MMDLSFHLNWIESKSNQMFLLEHQRSLIIYLLDGYNTLKEAIECMTRNNEEVNMEQLKGMCLYLIASDKIRCLDEFNHELAFAYKLCYTRSDIADLF